MLNVVKTNPDSKDQQTVPGFVHEGVVSLSPIMMNAVLKECGYEHQRAISERHVSVLTDLMRRDQWQPKSQIDFAVLRGRYILINGYHRAYAQVRSGKTITWNVALHPAKTDADLRSLYYAFDTNVKIRGERDILIASEFSQLHGLGGDLSAALYRAMPLIGRRFSVNHYDNDVLLNKQVDRRLALASEYAKAAGRFGACLEGLPTQRKKKLLSGAVTAVAIVTFRYQSERAWQFWSGVASMDGLKRGDPRLTLASDFLARKVNSGQPAAFAPSIIAWNAWFDERELRIIKVMDSFVPAIDGTPFDGKPFKKAA
jgi:hypothetical protein